MLGGDTAFDLTAALATCATGGSYCGQAQSDLAKKDAGAAATLTAIMNGDAWEGIKSTTIKAANGDQKALESFAGVLSGALISAKILPSEGASANVVGKVESPNLKKPSNNPNSSSAVTDVEAGGYSYYDQFKNANGGWDWPKNLGFEGDPIKTTIPVGTRLDRYGEPGGSFLAPKGTPYEQRALAPGAKAEKYYEYEVVKPLPAIQGKIAPAFGEPGGGIQILPNMQERVNVDWLVKNGYLREIK
ncbi:hypothetical protein GCM10009132_10440 [Serratia ureilytica]